MVNGKKVSEEEYQRMVREGLIKPAKTTKTEKKRPSKPKTKKKSQVMYKLGDKTITQAEYDEMLSRGEIKAATK